tara:strand:+ start:309 stop:1874 length:1566 start_codon:yes stop_codon:yes gene_type:complete
MKTFFKAPILDRIQLILLSILPASIVSGPLLPEIIINSISIFFLIEKFNNKNLSIHKNYIFIGFFIFYLVQIISLVFSEIFLQSFVNVLFYFRFFLFAFAACELLKKNVNYLNFLYLFLSLTLVIVIIDGYIQFFSGYNTFGFPKYRPDRISGFFNEDLILGSYLFRIIPVFLALTLYINHKNRFMYFFNLFVFFISVILIFLAGDRAPFFLIIIFMILVLTQINVSKKILFFCSASIILILLMTLTLNPTISDRYINQTKSHIFGFEGNDLFLREYMPMFSSAFKMFKEKPILGFGPKSYRIYCNDKRFVSYYTFRKNIKDNTIIKIDLGWKNSWKNFKIKEIYVNSGDSIQIGDKLFTYYYTNNEKSKKIFYDYFSKKEGLINKIINREIYINNTIFAKITPLESPEKVVTIPNSCNTHPHNIYLQLLAETGLLGFMIVLVTFFTILFLLIKNFFGVYFLKKTNLTNPEICLLSGFFVILWPITTSGDFFNNWINIISFYPLCFYLYIKHYKNDKTESI